MAEERKIIIAENIRKYIKRDGITQRQLAKDIDIAASTLTDYLQLRSAPSHGVIQKMADYFGVNKSDIDTTYKTPKTEDSIANIYDQLNKGRKKKVYTYATDQLKEQQAEDNVTQVDFGRVDEEPNQFVKSGRRSAAGSAIYNDDNDTRLDVRSASLVPKDADELVEVVGDSMEPLIHDGDEVYIRYQPTVENGEIAIVRIQDEGVTCKRVYVYPDKITLRSINEEYDDMHFDPGMITILGKVIE